MSRKTRPIHFRSHLILALTLVRARRVMELHPAESIIMKDLGPNSQSSSNNPPPNLDRGTNYEKGILQARLKYVRSKLKSKDPARR
ncbi:hypothetical protein TNCV_1412591 [Trichonephila clavipes]|nr:hypothetical protein TNCV_1412591 [Trichonephila clavipes]